MALAILLHIFDCFFSNTMLGVLLMFLKKYTVFIGLIVFLALCYFVSDHKSTRIWRERSEKAFIQKNTAHGLLYALRAEQTAGLIDRFNLVKQRIMLQSPDESLVYLVAMIAIEFFSSFAIFFPVIVTQLVCLLVFLYLAWLIGLLGFSLALRQNVRLTLCMFFLVCFLMMQYQRDGARQGVIFERDLSLVSGPGETFASVGSIKGPQSVLIWENAGSFLKIQAGFSQGWVLSKLVKIV